MALERTYDLEEGTGIGRRLVVIYSLLIFFTTIVVSLRIYTRAKILRYMGWDDACAVIALILGVAHSVIGIFGIRYYAHGRLGSAMPSGYQAIGIGPPWQQKLWQDSILVNWVAHIIFNFAIPFARASLILLILRFEPSRTLTIAYKVLFILNIITAIFRILTTIFQCRNPRHIWDPDRHSPNFNHEKDCYLQLYGEAFFMLGPVCDIILNTLVFVLPLGFLLKLRVSLRQRLELSGVFLLGLLSLLGSIMTLVMYKALQNDRNYDDRYEGLVITGNFFMWSNIETQVMVICSSLPILRGLYKYYNGTLRTPNGSRSKHYNPGLEGGKCGGKIKVGGWPGIRCYPSRPSVESSSSITRHGAGRPRNSSTFHLNHPDTFGTPSPRTKIKSVYGIRDLELARLADHDHNQGSGRWRGSFSETATLADDSRLNSQRDSLYESVRAPERVAMMDSGMETRRSSRVLPASPLVVPLTISTIR